MHVLFMEGYISLACLLAYWMYPSMCYGMSLGLIRMLVGLMNELDIMTFGSVVLNHSWWLCFECASLELIFVDNIHDLLF